MFDNSLQYSSDEFMQLINQCDIISRSYFSQWNGATEKALQTAKKTLRAEQRHLERMVHQSTKTNIGYRPNEITISHQIKLASLAVM